MVVCGCALQQYVPLFLNREDLDVAVQNAYQQRNAAQIQVYRDKANKYEDEYNQVRTKGRERAYFILILLDCDCLC